MIAATTATAATFRRRRTVHGRHDPTVGRCDTVGRGGSDRAAGTAGIEGGIFLGIVSRAPTARRTCTAPCTPGPSLDVAGDAVSATAIARTGSIATTRTSSTRSGSAAIGILPTIGRRVFGTDSDVADRTEEAGVRRRPEGRGEGPLHASGGPDGL